MKSLGKGFSIIFWSKVA